MLDDDPEDRDTEEPFLLLYVGWERMEASEDCAL